MPTALKRGIGAFLGYIPLKYILGNQYRKNYNFICESQYWGVERIKTYQLEKLTEICKLAYNNTQFYKGEFEKIGFNPNKIFDIDEFKKLPLIDRDTLNENLDEMCTLNINLSNVDYTSTGGTSGSPLRFYIGADRSSIEYAYLI